MSQDSGTGAIWNASQAKVSRDSTQVLCMASAVVPASPAASVAGLLPLPPPPLPVRFLLLPPSPPLSLPPPHTHMPLKVTQGHWVPAMVVNVDDVCETLSFERRGLERGRWPRVQRGLRAWASLSWDVTAPGPAAQVPSRRLPKPQAAASRRLSQTQLWAERPVEGEPCSCPA